MLSAMSASSVFFVSEELDKGMMGTTGLVVTEVQQNRKVKGGFCLKHKKVEIE